MRIVFQFLNIFLFASCSINVQNTAYYDLLGIPVNASREQIEEIQSGLHFNQHLPEPLLSEGKRLMEILTEICEILKDPLKRQDYDANGPQIAANAHDFFRYHSDVFFLITLQMNTDQNSELQILQQNYWNHLDLTNTSASQFYLVNANIQVLWEILNAALLSNHVGWFIEALMYLRGHIVASILAHATHPRKCPIVIKFEHFLNMQFKVDLSYDLDEFRAFLRSILSRYRPMIPIVDGQLSVIDRIGSLERDLANERFLRDFSQYLSFPVSYMLLNHDPLKVAETLSSSLQASKYSLLALDSAKEQKKKVSLANSCFESELSYLESE